jgi:hypothetical protein
MRRHGARTRHPSSRALSQDDGGSCTMKDSAVSRLRLESFVSPSVFF